MYIDSGKFVDDTKGFKKKAYDVRIKLLWSKYGPFIIVGIVLLLIIFVKFYW